MIDWSAKSTATTQKPSRDAIWIGDLSSRGQSESYCRTRIAADDLCRAILRDAVARHERVLIGFDFPFGYPRGFAAAVGLHGLAPWEALQRDLADRISDDVKNVNNRFEVVKSYNVATGVGPGPFWGCTAAHADSALTTKSIGLLSFPYGVEGGSLAKFRATETLIPGTVQETWKLLGTGSVGSQALVGINRVARLRFNPEFGALSRI